MEIFGVVSDGGKGNTKFFRMLCGNLPMNSPWPELDSIRCLNPVDPTRYMYFISCLTHCLKSLRNNLFRSFVGRSKQLKHFGVEFGWKEMEPILIRENIRIGNHEAKRTDLVKHAVSLDNYTMMNAEYAKQVFSEKTIAEILSHLFKYIGGKIDHTIIHKSQWHKFRFHLDSINQSVTRHTPLYFK